MPVIRTPPLGVYVHLPWCVSKCPYCDFNSHELQGGLPEQAYLDALGADLAGACATTGARPADSVFFGGGTPSLFTARSIGQVLEHVAIAPGLAGGAEVTMEANPGAVEHDAFAQYAKAGVTRLSLGVQSFDRGLLAAIGRIHGSQEAVAALTAARSAGFCDINIDLMYGLPGQTVSQALHDLRVAAESGVEHISWYQLTIEPNTAFGARPPSLPDEDVIAGMQDEGGQFLASMGYERYEVSAWAREGHECVHNLNYWRFGDYLGVGAGAHAKVTDAASGAIMRESRLRHPRSYMQAVPGGHVATHSVLSVDDRIFEFMLNALRLVSGFDVGLFESRTGLEVGLIEGLLRQLQQQGLLYYDGSRVKATEVGYLHLNEVIARFLTPRWEDAGRASGTA